MKNLTELLEINYYSHHGYWTADFIIGCFLLMITLYLLTTLLHHELKVERRKILGFFSVPIEYKYSVISKWICFIVAVISVF